MSWKINQPTLSVVVVAICGSTYLTRCLNALTKQVGIPKFEIIVAYDETLKDIPPLRNKFPEVQMCTVKGMITPEELASLGIRKTHGQVIALTEDHCIPDEHWCERILEAHASTHAAVGGAVECLPSTVLNWAFAYCDYYRYLNPVPEGLTRYLTVCNVAYKRSALEKIAKAWGNHFHEVTVNEALLANGDTMRLTSLQVVYQERNVKFFPAIHERYSFGRLFGSRRALAIPPIRRFLYTVCAPAVPFLLLGRMLKNVLLRRRCIGIFIRAVPALTVLTLAWSLGEFLGNLIGRIPQRVYMARS